jgi:hypothetical protein
MTSEQTFIWSLYEIFHEKMQNVLENQILVAPILDTRVSKFGLTSQNSETLTASKFGNFKGVLGWLTALLQSCPQ